MTMTIPSKPGKGQTISEMLSPYPLYFYADHSPSGDWCRVINNRTDEVVVDFIQNQVRASALAFQMNLGVSK